VLANNAKNEGLSWLVSPYTYNKWSTIQKASGYPVYLIEDNAVGSDRVVVTNNLSSTNQCLFGDFSKAVLAVFGVTLLFDRFTKMDQNLVVCTATLLYSFGVLRGSQIIRSEDAANQ
jgi:hypothetical protein